jgi:hypothetical protein
MKEIIMSDNATPTTEKKIEAPQTAGAAPGAVNDSDPPCCTAPGDPHGGPDT